MNKRQDYFENTGGLNITDSAFVVADNQATDGYNFEYLKTGAIRKSLGYAKINTSADAQTRSKGMGILNPVSGSIVPLRAAGTKLQTVNVSTGAFTNVTQDTAAVNSDFFTTSTQPVIFQTFNTTSKDTTVCVGAGVSGPIAYVGTTNKVTYLGVAEPTGSALSLSAGSSGGTIPTGTYFYAVALRKTSTGNISNATLDNSVAVTLGQKVTITLPTVSDQTLYDKFYIYRSAAGGVTGFTTGVLVATVNTSEASYLDNGTDLTTTDFVPREGLADLDNSPPVSGTYNCVAMYKRTLVLATGSTIYFSDLNKHESYPIDKYITIPSGGAITALAVLAFSSPYQSTEEILCVFKNNEMWLISGSGAYDSDLGIYDYELKFLDSVGCAGQSLVINTGGFIAFIDYRGIYMWNGSGKPTYVSRPLESAFQNDGDIDKSKLIYGFGVFFRKFNQIIWFLSHKIYGDNKLALKIDLRLTSPTITQNIINVISDAVFTSEKRSDSMFAGVTYLPSDTLDETFLTGDDAGYVYNMYNVYNEAGDAISFSYTTKWLDQGSRGVAKRYNKVVVFVEEVGDWDLTLKYSANYNPFDANSSQITETLSPTETNASGLWDVAIWDVGFWDQANNKIRAISFNLNSNNNANEGDSLRLTFSQSGADQPVIIYGFSIYYDEIAVRK